MAVQGGSQERIVDSSYFQSDGIEDKCPEVLFPNVFTPVHPWGDSPTECPVKNEAIKLKIENLVHATHKKEATNIMTTNKFEARPKFGKKLGVYDGSPCGESFKYIGGDGFDKNRYVQIGRNETVFNGHFSWWSISPTTRNLQGELFNKQKGTNFYVADYLKPEPESRYGGHAFEFQFSTLLKYYAQSRGTEVTNVYMRVGGTLRYRYEICYVIILCTDEDEIHLKEYDLLKPKSGPFNFENFINENGKILGEDEKDMERRYRGEDDTPTFSPTNVVTWLNGEHYSYETVAFAFYFPSGITIPEGHASAKSYHDTIGHEKCIRTQPPEWKCPDKMMKL